MDVLKVLTEEHAAIRRILDALGRATERALVADAGVVRSLVEVLSLLVREVHFPKEEECALGRIRMADAMDNPQLLAVVAERDLAADLLSGVVALASGQPLDVEALVTEIDRLAIWLRQVLDEEEQVLFPALLERLGPMEQHEMAEELARAADGDGAERRAFLLGTQAGDVEPWLWTEPAAAAD